MERTHNITTALFPQQKLCLGKMDCGLTVDLTLIHLTKR